MLNGHIVCRDETQDWFCLQLLKRQAEEIDILVKNMKEEHEELRSTYREELEEIENALMEVTTSVCNIHAAAEWHWD